MVRFINICLCLGLVVLAYVIYEVKYDTRAFDVDIAALSKDIEAERDSVAVLRAEWSLLNRPERIERLAQKYLNLTPAKPQQLLVLDTATARDLERALIPVAAPTPQTVSKPALPMPPAAPKPAKASKPAAAPRAPIQAAVH